MSNKLLFQAGLFCLKEAVYNVLSEAAETETPGLYNWDISERLGMERSFEPDAQYALLLGALDELKRDVRVERVDSSSRYMIWRIVS